MKEMRQLPEQSIDVSFMPKGRTKAIHATFSNRDDAAKYYDDISDGRCCGVSPRYNSLLGSPPETKSSPDRE